jgi:hypothetical protein
MDTRRREERWAQQRDFFAKQIATWEAFVPECDAEMEDRQRHIDGAKHCLDVTLRCETGRARELWDAIADIMEVKGAARDWRRMTELAEERNKLIGLK